MKEGVDYKVEKTKNSEGRVIASKVVMLKGDKKKKPKSTSDK